MEMKSSPIKLRYIIAGIIACVFILAAGGYLVVKYDLFNWVLSIVNEGTPAELFIVLMIVLPMIGVPFSVFIFLLAVKFGVLKGILLLEVVLPIQMFVAYFLVVSIRKPIENYLINHLNYKLPTIPKDKELVFSFFFLAVPGIPYAPKIYLLPLAGIPFRYCFWMNWILQGILAIPFVLAGKSIVDIFGSVLGESGEGIDYTLLVVTVLFFILLYIFLRWAKKRFAAIEKEKSA